MKLRILWTMGALWLLLSVGLAAQMAPLAPGHGPFTWTAYPTDEIGIADAPMATEITPAGGLYTGWGELDFYVGYPLRPVRQPERTLEDGDLPIVHYRFRDGQVRYQARLFSWALDPRHPDRQPVNYITIVAHNASARPRTSYFTLGFRYSGGMTGPGATGAHRFRRPVAPGKPGDYSQPGVKFDPHWTYGFRQLAGAGLALRSGQIVYSFPPAPRPRLSQPYGQARKLSVYPATPALEARYALHLAPGATERLNFKMPVEPIALADAAAVRRFTGLRTAAALKLARAWWRAQLRRGLQLELGEPKTLATFRASLMYLMLARDRVRQAAAPGRPGRNLYVQTVNKLQYHAFWLRDGSFMLRAYDLSGHPRRAAQCLAFFPRFQLADGNFLSQQGQHDGWGEALWAVGQHEQLTGDRGFAAAWWPRAARAVAWLERARAKDPLGLLPGGNPHDDEFVNTWAHITGDNFLALDGLHAAIALARGLGHAAHAVAWQRLYANYHQALFSRLRRDGASNGGYMPPGVDAAGGQDWGNLMGVYPHALLAPNDPLVTGTLRHALSHYGEGLITWGPYLHHYLTMNDTETWVRRGNQRAALRELYAILVHTSSTQAGWEVGPRPWTTRDFGGDLAPHGWFAADYIALLRNMLIEGEGRQLHLLSVLAPAWSHAGEKLAVRNAPTRFGTVTLRARFSASGMQLRLRTRFRQPPETIVLHLPWYVRASGATVDGRAVKIAGRTLQLPAGARAIAIRWQRRPATAAYSYRGAAAQFRAEWQRRYRAFRRQGMPKRIPARLK